MPFQIVRNDIVNMCVDAVVNTANRYPVVGSGVDAAIHKNAGRELMEARKKIGEISSGKAVITPGFNLKSKYVIHTVGPAWIDGEHGEADSLASCYRNSLQLSKEKNIKSIAFPLIATGNFGFPKPLALQIAVREISSFLMDNDMLIYLVVFESTAFKLSEKLFFTIKSYIDENYIEETIKEEYGDGIDSPDRILKNRFSAIGGKLSPSGSIQSLACAEESQNVKDELKYRLKKLDLGFSETLLKLIDESGKSDPEIYKKANVDRKLFSKIRNNPKYRPSKTTALAFAIALELDFNDTSDFIGRAGYALSNCSKFDIIVKYFIDNKIYDVYELNEVLFEFDQPLIGG